MDKENVFEVYRRLSWRRGSDFEVDQDRAWDSMLSQTKSCFSDELKYTNDNDRGTFNRLTNELMAVGVLFPCSGGKVQVVQKEEPSASIEGALEFAELIGNLFIRVHNGVTVADLEYMRLRNWDYVADGVFKRRSL